MKKFSAAIIAASLIGMFLVGTAQAQLTVGGNGSGSPAAFVNCDTSVLYDASTNGATQLVALSSGKKIYVCAFNFINSTTTAVHVGLVYGTGSNCATGQTKITPAYNITAVSANVPSGLQVTGPTGATGLQTTASQELCILTDAAVSVQALVWYTQF